MSQLNPEGKMILTMKFLPEEYTIENIKSACMKHFGVPEDGILCCDVLAGEQGPSCFSVKEIPNI